MRSGGRHDLWLGLALILVAVGYAWLAFHLPARALREVVGPDLFPKLLAALLVLLALLLVVRARHWRDARETAPPAEWAQVALAIGLMLAYVWALPRIGLLLATPIYLGVTMRLAGASRWPITLGITLLITAVIYFCFVTLFAVPLPRGPWF